MPIVQTLPAETPTTRPSWPVASLRVYLVGIILVASLPIAFFLAWHLYRSVVTEDERRQAELMQAASSMAGTVERELQSTVEALVILARSATPSASQTHSLERHLRELSALRSTWGGVVFADPEGRIVFVAGGADSRGPAVSLHDFDLALPAAASKVFISNLLPADRQGRLWTVVAVPVTVGPGVQGMLGALIPVSVWQDLVRQAAPSDSGFVSIFGRDQRLIARSLSPERFLGQQLPQPAVAAMAGRAAGTFRTRLLEGDEIYGGWQQVSLAGWSVGVGMPAAPIDAARRAAVWTAVLTTSAFVLIGLLGALLVARRVTLPLEELATTPVRSPGKPIAVREIAWLRDALARAARNDRAAHERLQRKADEFEALFRCSPIGLAFAADAAATDIRFNPALEQLLAPSPEGTAPEVWQGDQPLALHQQPLQRAAARGETSAALELELRAHGRPSLFVQASAAPVLDSAGRPRGAVGAMVDISEHKRSEAQLRSAEQRLRESQRLMDLAQEAGHVGFFHYQFGSDSLTWTPGQALLFGLAAGQHETTLAEWVRRIDEGDRARVEQSIRSALAARHERQTFDFRVRHGTHWGWLSCRVLLTYDTDGQPQQMVGVTVDVTDQKLVERERAAAVEREQAARLEAEASNRAKDEFLAMLSHELRNPLSAIASAAEVLHRGDIEAGIADEATRIIARQTRHLARLMDDLLDVSRLVSGKIALTRAPVELAALSEAVVATIRLTGAESAALITTQVSEVWVHADATRIEQVLSNLLTNALRYTPAGGSIRLMVRAEAAMAVIELEDSGAGIPAALLPRVFDLFVQGERSIDRRAGGLGIGLTLVRRMIELHDGTVAVNSDAAGTRFVIRLPAIVAPLATLQVEVRIPPSLRRRVLLIEDNSDALLAMKTVLDLDGHAVTTASDGAAGLAELLAARPEVAVVDLGLPGLTGFEVARASREHGFTGRLIAISGYGQERDIAQALAAGFDAHLVKPVDIDMLRTLLTVRD